MKPLETDEEFLLSLSDLVTTLNQETDKGALVVVEGKRDARALSILGFRGESLMLCNNHSVLDLAEKAVNYNKVILLFDFDRTGRYLTRKAASLLERRSKIDLNCRRRLRMASHGRIRYIEELGRFGEHLSSFYQ